MKDDANDTLIGIYGYPPAELRPDNWPRGALQFSPLSPDSLDLEDVEPHNLDRIAVLAPPGTVERRYTLALALEALVPGGELIALAPKDKGGSRIAKELAEFGCDVIENSKSHHRICATTCPDELIGTEDAIVAGSLQTVEALNLASQPGIFSWDRIDPATQLLLAHLPSFSGKGADFGCGIGVLALKVLESDKVTALTLIDIDRRAIAASKENVTDTRATLIWGDVREQNLTGLDFIVMNPPFHDGGTEDRALGQDFIRKSASCLRKGGALWLVANRHLPYEDILTPLFDNIRMVAQEQGFKIYEAIK
jgi:16S rRNA (guanine1207-N2)-methyltransferase